MMTLVANSSAGARPTPSRRFYRNAGICRNVHGLTGQRLIAGAYPNDVASNGRGSDQIHERLLVTEYTPVAAHISRKANIQNPRRCACSVNRFQLARRCSVRLFRQFFSPGHQTPALLHTAPSSTARGRRSRACRFRRRAAAMKTSSHLSRRSPAGTAFPMSAPVRIEQRTTVRSPRVKLISTA